MRSAASMPAPARARFALRSAAAILAAVLAAAEGAACPLSDARRAPVAAAIARPFGFALHPLLRTPVLGVDVVYATRAGMPVRATGDGRIRAVAPSRRGGAFVWIAQAASTRLRYGPLAARVRAGACVTAGARLGSTVRAPFALRMRRAGAWADPLHRRAGQ